MPNIFGSQPGRVSVIEDDTNAYPLSFEIPNFRGPGGYLGYKALVTAIAINGKSSVQIMHTLRQYIYIYTFGERIGELNINGLIFTADCGSSEQATGLSRLMDWYDRFRLSTTGTPIRVNLTKDWAVNAFLISFNFQIEDPSISLGRFAMQLVFPPRFVSKNQPPRYYFPSTVSQGSVSGQGTTNVLTTAPPSNGNASWYIKLG